MKNIAILLFLFQLYSCSYTSADYTIDNLDEEGIVLKTWRIIGPIRTTEKKPSLVTDYLTDYGKSELSLRYADLETIQPLHAKQFENRQVDSAGLEGLLVDFNEVLNINQPDSIKGVAYAGCTIESSHKQDLKLNFACSGGAKIWLNNTLIFTNEHAGDLNPYENYIDLPLKQGKNFLLVKTNKKGDKWEMFAAIEKNSKERITRHKRNFELSFGNYYLSRNIIENDTIRLAFGIWDEHLKLEIEGVDTPLNIKANQPINIADLPDGFYSTKLYARNDTFTSRFYKVKDFAKAYKSLADSISLLLSKKDTTIFKALVYRHDHLMKPENYPKKDYQKKSWDKRMLFVFDNLLTQYNMLKNSITEADAKGCLLRSYRSKIDNATQYYVLHVPAGYKKGQPIPLVIEMSKLMKWFPSVLETNRFANISLMEHFDDLANKYNIMVVEPGNRTVDKPNYNDIDEVDLWEALDDIKKTYAIDTTRVYLLGSCRAAYDALKLAVRYPDRFAGLGIVSPELSTSSGNVEEKNDPLHFLGNIKDLPIYNIHSQVDTHSTIQASERLWLLAKQAALKNFRYRKLPLEFKPYYTEEYLDDYFSFFSNLPPGTTPSSVHFSTNQLKYNQSFYLTLNNINTGKSATIDAFIKGNVITIERMNVFTYTIDVEKIPFNKNEPLTVIDNGKQVSYKKTGEGKIIITDEGFKKMNNHKSSQVEGPFAHIFLKPFIVVPGTIGNAQDIDQIKNVITVLNEDWKRRYYTNLVVKSDKKISAEEIKNSNLILVGSPESNLILKKLVTKLPLKVSKGFVEINSQRLYGHDLNYYLIYPNPNNSTKYVGVLGYNNSKTFKLSSELDYNTPFNDISNYGWYDYKIWKDDGKSVFGYFDYKWK